MSLLKSKLSVLSVIVGCGACAALMFGAMGSGEQPGGVAEPEQAPVAAPRAGQCAFEVGALASYEVETRSALSMGLEAVQRQMDMQQRGTKGAKMDVQSSPKQERTQAATWRLDTEVLARAEGGAATVVAARLVPVAGEKQALDSGRTFLMRVRSDCTIADFARAREATVAGAYVQQALLSTLGFSASAGDHEVIDGFGESKVRFGRDGERVRAEVLRYTKSYARGSGMLPVETALSIVASSREVEVSPHAWFARSEGVTEVAMSVQGTPSARLRHAHNARLLRAQGWRSGASALDTSWVWGRVLDRAPASTQPSWQVRQELVGVKAGVALSQVAEMMRTRSRGLMGYSGYLRDWIRANPEQLAALKAWLLQPSTKETAQLRSVLFMALGQANTPESRALLMAIMTDGQHSKGDTSSAGLALVRAHPVPEGYLDALVAGSKDLERHGTMTSLLGMVASEQAEQNPEVAAAARAEIRKLLQSAEDTRGRRQAIVAVGNTGDPSMMADLKPYLSGEDAELRELAVRSLRRMPAEVAVPIVEQVLSTDKDDAMQMTAMNVLRQQLTQNPEAITPNLRARLTGHITSEDPKQAAMQMMSVDMLGGIAQGGDAAAQKVIADAFNRELQKPNKNVRLLTKLGSYHNNTWTKGR